MSWNKKLLWITWLIFTLMMSGYFAYSMTSEDQTIFLPGQTSVGHYQIEMKCDTCHGESFSDKDDLQKSCMKCHGKELKIADDKHPKSKFTDPRNADRTAILDARYCITCHVEHKPEVTREMGVTVAADVCHLCHYDIAEDRKSHEGMAFTTCDSAGCHNFHDNRGLYEDFLLKHVGEADTIENAQVAKKSDATQIAQLYGYPQKQYPVRELGESDIDAPSTFNNEQKILQEWHQTSHAKSGVNCSACHLVKDSKTNVSGWIKKPTHKVCEQCHDRQVKGFLAGRHGMRLAEGLTPMKPASAKIPMHKRSLKKELTCTSCHNDHKFDVRHAAVDACLSCHNDDHSLAYKESVHYQLWLKASSGLALETTGVSCATCHLPREKHKQEELEVVSVQHNQNDNLRPNEKMLRSVCMNCHGLAFSIDALADAQLVSGNFQNAPKKHIESIEMAVIRKEEKRKEKELQGIKHDGGDEDSGFL